MAVRYFLIPVPDPRFSNLRDQMRLLNVAERYLYGADAGLPALAVLPDRGKVEGDCGLRARNCFADQPSLPMPVIVNGLKRLHLDQAALKPLKILSPGQLAVQARGTR